MLAPPGHTVLVSGTARVLQTRAARPSRHRREPRPVPALEPEDTAHQPREGRAQRVVDERRALQGAHDVDPGDDVGGLLRREQVPEGHRRLCAGLAGGDEDHPARVAFRRAHRRGEGRRVVLDRGALAGLDEPIGDAEAVEEAALGSEIGAGPGMATVEPRRCEQHGVRKGAGPSQGLLRPGRAVVEKAVEGRLHRTAHRVRAERLGEGQGREVQRGLSRQLTKPRLVGKRARTWLRGFPVSSHDVEREGARRAGLTARLRRAAREELGEELPRRLPVHERVELPGGEVAAEQVGPAGAADRQQRQDGEERSPAPGAQRRARGEHPSRPFVLDPAPGTIARDHRPLTDVGLQYLTGLVARACSNARHGACAILPGGRPLVAGSARPACTVGGPSQARVAHWSGP